MTRYGEAQFGATHNSYSGGARGSLVSQLARRIRCVEFDFHDNGYEEYRDYRIGHMTPGHEVERGHGNPTGLLLHNWLSVIADWSKQNSGHGPITIVLDAKDDLTDNDESGDLEDLNCMLELVFGPTMFTRDEYGAGPWPDVATLRNRVLCVLSGNQGTRSYYRWTRGTSPALAVNAGGEVVLAYQSISGDLRCWTGRFDALGGRVAWLRRATYQWSAAPLWNPAIALNDDGWVVAVHALGASSDFPAPRVECRVGRLGTDGRIKWSTSTTYYSLGSAPTVRIDGDELRSIYLAPDGTRHMLCNGTLNRQRRKVEWRKPRSTPSPLLPRDTAQWQSHTLRASAAAGGIIHLALDGAAPEPVRFRQLAFVEQQRGDDALLQAGVLFFAGDAKNKAVLASARNAGLVTRAWGFEPGDETRPPSNMPATDAPDLAQYAAYLRSPGIVA